MAAKEDFEELASIRTKTETRINIEVKQLGLKLKSNGYPVLAGVNGKIHAGGVTAVMGPSGAGKTTFLNTLAGKASYGRVTGEVLVNGHVDQLSNYSTCIGFVPQVSECLRRSDGGAAGRGG